MIQFACDEMSRPNKVPFATIKTGLVQSGYTAEALRLFGRRHGYSVCIDRVPAYGVLVSFSITEGILIIQTEDNKESI